MSVIRNALLLKRQVTPALAWAVAGGRREQMVGQENEKSLDFIEDEKRVSR